ncbi:hypothetical protein ACWGJ9_11455 [Curtobacterium citreum]
MTAPVPASPKKIGLWKTIFGGAGFLAAFILAPLFGGVFILGAVVGFIADGVRLHNDNTLRATGTETTVVIDDIDVRRFSENWGRTRTECVPVVTGPVDGKPHTWDLVQYADCDNAPAAGDTLRLVVDPSDVDHVVFADPDALNVHRHNLGVDVQLLVIGVGLAAVGTGCWLWLTRDNKRHAKQQTQP